MQKEKERIWSLISRKLAKEASREELLELQQLIDGNYKAGLVLEILTELFKTPARQSEPIRSCVAYLDPVEPSADPARLPAAQSLSSAVPGDASELNLDLPQPPFPGDPDAAGELNPADPPHFDRKAAYQRLLGRIQREDPRPDN